MDARISALLFAVVFLFSAAHSFADAQEGERYVSILGSYYDDDEDRLLDDGFSGARLATGYAFHPNWNIEALLSFNDPDGPAAQTQFEVGADLQFVMARQSAFTPYLFVGASYLEVDPSVGEKDNGEALSAGAGVLIDMFGSSNVALRAEYRFRTDDVLGTDFGDQFASIGLQFPFGAKPLPIPPRTPVDPDSDGDGVPDSIDRCLSTPTGIQVDASGCPLDGDGDGVPDHLDQCANTVPGAVVDENGCELDTDADGVVDRNDKCPSTREGAQVDVAGCEIREEIRLPGVNFESNSDVLLDSATTTLNNAAETLRRNPTITVEVAGHTDSDGAAAYNESLSARRARAVREYLIARGVEANRLTSRGYGESEPIADNSTREGKAQNRRVVLRIIDR